MLLQYTSDIHLEFRTLEQIPKLLKNIGADVLVLSGDICAVNTPEDFNKFLALLKYYTPRYKYVLHVSGNHEFYCTATPTLLICMDAVNRKLKALMKVYTNYIYLNCDVVTLLINKTNYRFIGATLWTKVSLKDRGEVQDRMNDYECIYLNKDKRCVKFTVADMQKLHSKHTLFIKKAISESITLKIPTVLITHHKPVADTAEKNINILTQAYESDITSIIVSPVKICVYGHTHVHYDKVINGVRYLSNPVGYPGQQTLYKNSLSVTVK